MMHARANKTSLKKSKQQKQSKVVKTLKKPITKTAKRSLTTISSTSRINNTLTTPFSLNTKSFTPPTNFLQQSSLLPQSTKRQFRSTQRLFNEPVATGPAAVDDVSPKVQGIIKDILSLNIMESLQLTKALKKEFGYSDSAFAMAAPVAVAGGAAPAAAAAEEEKPKAAAKTSFNIKLESYDAGSKVKIIKEVRTITGLGLKEAKELVDGAPQILKKEVKKEEAEAIVKTLKEVGAVCILE